MPWHIGSSDGCPSSKPYAVIKDSDGSVAGCHATKDAAKKQLAALYASEAAMTEHPQRAEWTAAYINDLPDSAFACIDGGGTKDEAGKTTPRSLRHYPHHDASGKVDEAHLANARARVKQQGTTSCGYDHLFDTHKLPSDGASSMKMSRPPRDNLVRAVFPGTEMRDDEAGNGTLFGHFAKFDEWTKIDSAFEGTFMERVAPGSFAKTFAENRHRIKITLNHGQDPQLGDKPIAVPETLAEDDDGAYYEAPLLDGVPPLVVSGLRKNAYGSSFRFRVTREDYNKSPKAAAHNPDALPERTIREVELYEFGPVTYPAYAGATASIRSATDDYYRHLIPPDAPSVDAGAQPHLEPERRDEPADPPPQVAADIPQDPPDGGSSDSKERKVEYVTRDEKAARATELKAAIATLAKEHPGVMPEEAQARWDADNKELDELESDIRAWDARMARIRAFAEDEAKVDKPEPYALPAVIRSQSTEDIYDVVKIERSSRTHEERDQKLRDNALRAIEGTRFLGNGIDQADVKARVSALVDYGDSDDKEVARLVLNTGSPSYRRAFTRYVASGGSERAAALAVGVDATGGFSVPVAFDPSIIAIGSHSGAINPYRQACRTVSITGTDTWQALTATAIVSAYAAEAAAATEQGPTFARPEYIVKRAHSFVTASYEMAQDRPDLASELAVLFQESKDNLEETQFTTGVGTTVFPQGMFLDGAYTAVETVGNNVVAVADIYALEAALPIRYRANGAWFMNRAVIHTVAGFETATGHLFNGTNYASVGAIQTNPGGNTGLRLLGYPVWEVPSASALITTSAAIVAVFADPRTYVIVDRVGMSVKVIPDMLNGATPSFPTGEIGIYAFWRNTARVLVADGGRQLKVNAP
jgi:HK97 family phage major capsid protein